MCGMNVQGRMRKRHCIAPLLVSFTSSGQHYTSAAVQKTMQKTHEAPRGISSVFRAVRRSASPKRLFFISESERSAPSGLKSA